MIAATNEMPISEFDAFRVQAFEANKWLLWRTGRRAITRTLPVLPPAAGASGAVAALGHRQAELWSGILMRVPDGAEALLISHGGLIEPGLVAALPDWPHVRWGRGFRHCEGARLRDDGRRFLDAEILFCK
jgi:hypothetical protein